MLTKPASIGFTKAMIKILPIAIGVLGLSLFASCASPAAPGGASHQLSVSWSFNSPGSRAIFPTTFPLVDTYTVTLFTGGTVANNSVTGGTQVSGATQTVNGSTASFSGLSTQTYQVLVQGYNSLASSALVAQGAVSVDMTSTSASTAVTLAYVGSGTGGSGTLNLSFTLSGTISGGTPSSATYTLAPLGSGSTTSGSLTSTNGNFPYTLSLASVTIGSWLLTVQVQAGAVWATLSDTVEIMQGQTTSSAVTIDGASFTNAIPLVLVPGGTFQRDATPGDNSTVSSFLMGKYPITRAQFLAVMGTDPSSTSNSTSLNDPVQMVSWYDAIAFCNKLSLLEGLTPVYTVGGVSDWSNSGLPYNNIPTSDNTTWDAVTEDLTANGYRLPTVMENMWASMGGQSDARSGDIPTVGGVNTGGYTKGYAGSTENGSATSKISNYAVSGTTTEPVGTKLPNELGIYDLSGNVWEWCWDWHNTSTPAGSLMNYLGQPASSDTTVQRTRLGGSYSTNSPVATVGSNVPAPGTSDTGFRVVRSLNPLYTITYNSNGGTVNGTAPYDPEAYLSGSLATVLNTTGYTPSGSYLSNLGNQLAAWNTNATPANGTDYVSSSQYPIGASNVTLYAHWVPDVTSANIGTLKYVQGGTFTLQSGGPNMTVSSFYMSQNLITGAEYASVTGLADPSYFSTVTNHPVEQVNWYGALVFCNDLSTEEGLTPVYSISGITTPSAWGTIPTADNSTWDAATVNSSANGYRLPTEMEYMWAAMGGYNDALPGDLANGVNVLGYNKGYAGSTEAGGAQTNIGTYAWYTTNSPSATQAVGTKKANELGIYDLSGNVFELCWDEYGTYPTTAQTNYQGVTGVTTRVAHGGSWLTSSSDCTVAYRLNSYNPYSTVDDVGFRVVRNYP